MSTKANKASKLKVAPKKGANKSEKTEQVYEHSTGEFKGTPMFYIRKEGQDETEFPAVALLRRKAKLLCDTPGALEALQEFAAEED